jgi:hypothetical protein
LIVLDESILSIVLDESILSIVFILLTLIH